MCFEGALALQGDVSQLREENTALRARLEELEEAALHWDARVRHLLI